MADTSAETFKKIDEALKGGRISEAAKLAADAAGAGAALSASAASLSAEPAEPRSADVVLADLLISIVAYLGNQPIMLGLLDNFLALKEPAADASAKPVA